MKVDDGDGGIIEFVEFDDAQLEFQQDLLDVLNKHRNIGPILHLCLVSQVMGKLMTFNTDPAILEGLRKTMMMNFDHGRAEAYAIMVEEMAEQRKN